MGRLRRGLDESRLAAITAGAQSRSRAGNSISLLILKHDRQSVCTLIRWPWVDGELPEREMVGRAAERALGGRRRRLVLALRLGARLALLLHGAPLRRRRRDRALIHRLCLLVS